MENTRRTKWMKPELIVLVRTKPQEVLSNVCKHPGGPATASIVGNMGCQVVNGCNTQEGS